MTGEQVRWTAEQVRELMPDAKAARAASTLARGSCWTEQGCDEQSVWGLCQGRGMNPYRIMVDLGADGQPAFRCSCPSRKLPCKHALALMQIWAHGEQLVPAGTAPEWMAEWLRSRRERSQRSVRRAADGAVVDAEAARKRAEQRAERVTAGAQELAERLSDLLREGLAGADRASYASWDEMAARMVDAQAPGLASRVRELGSIPASGAGWPARMLAECALLHLLSQGFLRRDELPEELAATVRGRVGLSTDTAALIAEQTAQGSLVTDEWLVLGSELRQADRLTERRTWLRGQRTGRFALLRAFAAGQAPEPAPAAGRVFDASLAFYPGGAPLRAVRQRTGTADGSTTDSPSVHLSGPAAGPPGVGVAEALAEFGHALRSDPWLTGWPVVLADVVPVPPPADGEQWQLASGSEAIPLLTGTGPAGWVLAAVSGGAPVTVFGECGPEGLTPHTMWAEGKAIPV